MHASVSTYTHTAGHIHTVGQRLARYLHGALDGEVDDGREGGVEGRSGEKRERRDEIEAHLPRC